MKEEPLLFHLLLDKLSDTMIRYLLAQIDAGAEVVQIFESHASLLTKEEYLQFAYPYEKKILEVVSKMAPTILFLRDTMRFIKEIRQLLQELGGDSCIVSFDEHSSLKEGRKILGPDVVLQGNLDPKILCNGTKDEIRHPTTHILESTKGEKHIFNLGHGVLKQTPPQNVSYVVDLVRGING